MEERPISDISYRKFLEEGKLMGSRCRACGRIYHPPRHFCEDCFGTDMEWQELRGEGELTTFTCIFVAPPYMAREGYGRDNPYCTGVVTLSEGPRVVARIEGVDARNPESIKIGTPVKAVFNRVGEGEEARTYLAFRPA